MFAFNIIDQILCYVDNGMFRESYVLTMTQALDSNDTTAASDSFVSTPVIFETLGGFEAEVIFRLFSRE